MSENEKITEIKLFFEERAKKMEESGKIVNCCDVCKEYLTETEGHLYPSIINLLCKRCYRLVFQLINKDQILAIRYKELLNKGGKVRITLKSSVGVSTCVDCGKQASWEEMISCIDCDTLLCPKCANKSHKGHDLHS